VEAVLKDIAEREAAAASAKTTETIAKTEGDDLRPGNSDGPARPELRECTRVEAEVLRGVAGYGPGV
jgi:hypothetical protein